MLDKFPEDKEWARFDFPEAKRAKESLNIIKLMIGNRSGIESALSAIDYGIRMAKQYDLPSASEEFLLLSEDRFVKGIMDTNLGENILKLSKHAAERYSSLAHVLTPNWKIIQSEQVTLRKLLLDINKHVTALENAAATLSNSSEYLSILEQSLQNLRILKEKIKEQNDLQKELDPSVLNEIESRLQKIIDGIKQDELMSSQKPSQSKASQPADAPTPGNLSNSVSVPNNFKIRNNVIRVPEDERKENITAVCNILNNDELMEGLDGTVPILIQQIRDLANAIDYSDEENISHALLTIKIKIRDAGPFKSTEYVNGVLDSFRHSNHLSFKEIRHDLEKNAVFKEQIESINAGSLSRP
ncbi:Sid related protein-like protein [Legionella quinlivanii]|uniref:Sid related protein-like protein n=2 Tax=Legionella quinlivanii TaxID=45073 RepID=A0A0W0XZ82_9GAMM|nr:SidE phosphodiesterase domain-containing protein [Legionella quinlivanii]KTD50012.1 Sid related protein-like protein [Legionella quinlivanii]SEF94731.1 Dot/Icm substrate protein [Legionella quinlivanii DSM 21216]STY11212.1 SdeC protein, substrate of the Dot/Icm system [Legionella quinlivanii]